MFGVENVAFRHSGMAHCRKVDEPLNAKKSSFKPSFSDLNSRIVALHSDQLIMKISNETNFCNWQTQFMWRSKLQNKSVGENFSQ